MIHLQKKRNMSNIKSPYNASITGGGFLLNEFLLLLPLLQDENRDELLKDEVANNRILQINSQTSRSKFIGEIKKRYLSVPFNFWTIFGNMSIEGKKAGMLYAILKTYKLLFDFHFNITIKRWNSIGHILQKNDIMMEFNEIGARDPFVEGWTENTKGKCATRYISILSQSGLLDETSDELTPIKLEPEEFEYYIRTGEEWFLEACLLYPYEINDIKSKLQ